MYCFSPPRLFDSVEVCLKDLEDECGLLDNKAHQGIISAYSWLCDEAFDGKNTALLSNSMKNMVGIASYKSWG